MGKHVSAFILVVLIASFFAGLIQLPTVQATSAIGIFSASSEDAYALGMDSNYTTARAHYDGLVLTSDSILIGQNFVTSYLISRGFLFFDTSSLPNNANITSAILSLYVWENNSATDFNVTIQTGGTHPSNPVVTSDYYYGFYSGNGGNKSTSEITGTGYWNITLNSDGLTWIDTSGTTELALRSSNDINGTAPTGQEWISILAANYLGGSYTAKLYVTYEAATIPTYGFTLKGPYSEETGQLLYEDVIVQVYSFDGPYTSFVVDNETFYYSTNYQVQYFRFLYEDNTTREYWVDPLETGGLIYILKSDLTVQTYTINFLDTAGILEDYPYVTVKQYVNGFLYTVEKRKVDVYNSFKATLAIGKTYTLTLGSEEQACIFGELLMTETAGVQLTLSPVDFPSDIEVQQKYVTVYGLRNYTASPNVITVLYSDTKLATEQVSIIISFENGTSAYSTLVNNTNSFSVDWSSANENYTYILDVSVSHAKYGSLTYRQIFPAHSEYRPLFYLEFLGTSWPVNSALLLPAFLVFCIAGCFSVVNAYAGGILMVLAAIVLTGIGWLPLPAGVLAGALAFALLMALAYMKRRAG